MRRSNKLILRGDALVEPVRDIRQVRLDIGEVLAERLYHRATTKN